MLVQLEKGDRVGYIPFGDSAKPMVGTVTKVNIHDDGEVTYDVMWDGFDWQTVDWRLDSFN